MSDENNAKSPLVGWLIGGLAVMTLIVWNYAGGTRTLWWLGFLLGPFSIFLLLGTLKSVAERNEVVAGLVWFVMVCCLAISGLTLLLGGAVALKVVASPFFGSSHSYEDEELPQNWR